VNPKKRARFEILLTRHSKWLPGQPRPTGPTSPRMKRPFLLLLPLLLIFTAHCIAEEPSKEIQVLPDVAYKSGDGLSDYEQQRCKLDVYLPAEHTGFATLIWFHGGGLTGGSKAGSDKMARSLAMAGVAVVVPNYRLSPKATFPAYIQDAAAACAWASAHIAEHGGDSARLFVGGHSAGGYLALMLGMDPHYLRDVGLEPSAIAGLIPVSGQTMTHYTVREERGIGKFTITADQAAPVYFIRKDTPPFLVLYADHDMVGRAEENAYFVAMMKGAGNQRITGKLIADRTHGSIAGRIVEDGDPARMAILEFITRAAAPER
jgi:acetyl esterase/lipase